MINFKLTFFVLLACIALGDATKCYKCISDRKTDCGKGEVDSMKEVECREDVGCLSYLSEGGIPSRGCSDVQTLVREEICEIAETHYRVSQCTSCYEDLCNGSPIQEEDDE